MPSLLCPLAIVRVLTALMLLHLLALLWLFLLREAFGGLRYLLAGWLFGGTASQQRPGLEHAGQWALCRKSCSTPRAAKSSWLIDNVLTLVC